MVNHILLKVLDSIFIIVSHFGFICSGSSNSKRHPRICKWEGNKGGCRRNKECDYLHINNDTDKSDICVYQCVSCKSIWNDKICMVEHTIKNMNIFFCLNCNDWVKNKESVLDQGWTLKQDF